MNQLSSILIRMFFQDSDPDPCFFKDRIRSKIVWISNTDFYSLKGILTAGPAAVAQSAEPVRVPPPAGLLCGPVPGEGSLTHRARHHVSP
jgi:hypothetical protein